MRKTILGTVIMMGLLLLGSCGKGTLTNPIHATQVGGGTWTFAGIRDTATSCLYDTGSGNYAAMGASNYTTSNTINYTTIRCGYNEKLVAGTYTVVPTTVNPTSSQISFEIDYGLGGLNGASWYSTGTGNQTVNVSISGNTITISGSGINIYCPVTHPTASDTSVLSLNLYSLYN